MHKKDSSRRLGLGAILLVVSFSCLACSTSPADAVKLDSSTPDATVPDDKVDASAASDTGSGEDAGIPKADIAGTIAWSEGGVAHMGKHNQNFRFTVQPKNGGLFILIVSDTTEPKLRLDMFFPSTAMLAVGSYPCQQSQETNGLYVNVNYTKAGFDYTVSGDPRIGDGMCNVAFTAPVSNGMPVQGTFNATLRGTNGAPNLTITNGVFDFADER
jgi:hypothetical protein